MLPDYVHFSSNVRSLAISPVLELTLYWQYSLAELLHDAQLPDCARFARKMHVDCNMLTIVVLQKTAECSGKCGTLLTKDGCILISICGHISCAACLKKAGRSACPEKSCKAWVAKTHQKVFGALDPAPGASAEPALDRIAVETHAQKLEMVTRLLLANPSDQAVMFVQDAGQFKAIEAAFGAKGITYDIISSDSEAGKIEAFKSANALETQVLVLEITKEYAAGTNLFNANHIIFLSPFFTVSEDDYAEKKLQAIRRVFRQGQVKSVFIHNLVSFPPGFHFLSGFISALAVISSLIVIFPGYLAWFISSPAFNFFPGFH